MTFLFYNFLFYNMKKYGIKPLFFYVNYANVKIS